LEQVREKHQLNKPFILADALKNPAVIIRAWKHLPASLRSKYQIVFFSRHPNPLQVVFDSVDSGISRLLIRPPREELINLFSQAQIFVFPSWIEGFGLPLLEAMSCGAPVIASDRGSIPEVAGEAALIIDAEDDRTLARYLTELLQNPERAADLRKRGFKRAAQFNWQQTAKEVISVYTSLL
jgi:glycosyltransferase involved in cell wall biosynthesis